MAHLPIKSLSTERFFTQPVLVLLASINHVKLPNFAVIHKQPMSYIGFIASTTFHEYNLF